MFVEKYPREFLILFFNLKIRFDFQADSIVVHSQAGNINCSGSLNGTIDLSTERDGVKINETISSIVFFRFFVFRLVNSSIEITGWFCSIKSRKFGSAGKKSLFRTFSYSRTTRNIPIGKSTRSRNR